MDLADVLAGLDAHPWASVSHAYGPAEDLPDLLRALAEGGADAEEAISELYSCILHQGTVYSASVDAVPYLARIAAAARPGTTEVLCLLGGLAESDDEWEIESGAVRAAVATQIPLLVTLLAHEDVNVRLLTAWTLGHTRNTEAAPVALRSRWTAEADPGVRAELLIALGRVDLSGAAVETRALLGAEPPAPLRLAALLVALAAGEPWTDAHHDAALGLLPAREFTVDRYSMHHREPLHAIVDSLLRRETEADRETAFALLDAALRDGRPEVRTEALSAADHACYLSRSAPQRLVPAIVPLATEYPASTLLGKLGPAAAEAAPVLAELAAQPDDEAADQALAVLVRVAPRQAAPLLARDLAIATALWQIDGDAEEAVTILASVLDRTSGNQPWCRWTVVRAIRATALLGAAARLLIPRLEQLLADPEKAPTAALALLAITDPDVVDLSRLAEAALHSAETGADLSGACKALQALGATALSTRQRLRVAELAEGDRRIVGSGAANSIIREDERLRAILTAI